jgi:flagellar assembly protein FliH
LRSRADRTPETPQPVQPAPEREFADIPDPPPARDASSGKVYGGGGNAQSRPSHLEDYAKTVIIGAEGVTEVNTDGSVAPPPDQTLIDQELDQNDDGPGTDSGIDQAPPPVQQPHNQMAEQQGREIIEQAQAQADQMIAEARQMVEQAQMQAGQTVSEAMAQAQQAAEEARQQAAQQGYEEGKEAGLVEGRQSGETQLQEMIEALKFQFVDIVRLRRKVMLDMEPEIVRLSWEVAKRVVGEELKTNREVIVGVVKSALSTLQERDEILIRVNPSEFDSVKVHQPALEAMIEGLKKFVIQPDGAIELGSCAIETNLGNVDARIETQFEAIKLGLDEMCGIRSFEREDQVDLMPVEVPGDPDFEQRMKERAAQPPEPEPQHHEEAVHQEHPPQQEMELLPEPTEEIFAQLTPEQQQEYMEAYQQQQAYLESMQQEMAQQQQQLLPEPTEELFATLTPEEQQQYMEAYQQQQQQLQQQQQMELLPEPTEELFATLTPEEQQQYMEAYQQQQAYLQQQQEEQQA